MKYHIQIKPKNQVPATLEKESYKIAKDSFKIAKASLVVALAALIISMIISVIFGVLGVKYMQKSIDLSVAVTNFDTLLCKTDTLLTKESKQNEILTNQFDLYRQEQNRINNDYELTQAGWISRLGAKCEILHTFNEGNALFYTNNIDKMEIIYSNLEKLKGSMIEELNNPLLHKNIDIIRDWQFTINLISSWQDGYNILKNRNFKQEGGTLYLNYENTWKTIKSTQLKTTFYVARGCVDKDNKEIIKIIQPIELMEERFYGGNQTPKQ